MYAPVFAGEEDFIHFPNMVEIKKTWNILLSESKQQLDIEIKRSLNRVKDFIKIAEEGGSGSYPEDFDYKGYKRDDGSVSHTKAPRDWGIDETFTFGSYHDAANRSTSAIQLATWLEYDNLVNGNHKVILEGNDTSLNSSGTAWFRDYCHANNIRGKEKINSVYLRNRIRETS